MPGGATRAAYAALLGIAALDAAGYSILAPIVPAIARKTDAGPAVMGALVTSFAAGQLAGYPLAGWALRRRHAGAVLAGAIALMTVGDLGFILGDGLGVYFPSRLIQGIGAGGLWMGVAFGVLERFPDEAYQRLAGVMGAYAIGGVAGPALGGIGGIRGPFVAHLALVGAGAVAVALMGAPATRPPFDSDRAVLRTRGFVLASAAIALVALSLGTFEGPLALHFGSRLSQGEISGLYVGVSVLLGLSAAAGGRLRPRLGLLVGSALVAGSIPVAAATHTVAIWILACGVLGIGLGVLETAALGILLETVGTTRMVLAMVVWSQLWGIGYLAGPAAGGGLAEALGAAGIGLVSLAGALLVAGALAVSARERVAG